jgi:hypothetical protein
MSEYTVIPLVSAIIQTKAYNIHPHVIHPYFIHPSVHSVRD